MKSLTLLRKLLPGAGFWMLIAFNALGQTTTTTLTSGNNPQCAIFDLTFTAVVSPSGATGTVEFLEGATLLGTGTISGGTATFTTNSLSAGNHTITAHYLGDGTYLESTSAPLSQEIRPRPVVTATPGSNTVCSGENFIILFGGASNYNWTRTNFTNTVGMADFGPGGTTSIDGALTNITTSVQTTVFSIIGVDNYGCVNQVDASVTVNPPPPVTVINGPDRVCTNSTITLTNATSPGTWSSSDPTIATVGATTGIVTGVTDGSVIITYRVTDGDDCPNSVIKAISVIESPEATVTGTTTICSGQSTTIIGTVLETPQQAVPFTNTNTNVVDFRQSNPLTPLTKTQNVDLHGYGITELSQISNISITVNVDHPRTQEVEMYLIAPGGPLPSQLNIDPTSPYIQPYTQDWQSFPGYIIPLVNNRGGSGSNFVNTAFSDAAGAAISSGTAPFSGSYRPEVAFSTLNPALDPSGNWTLYMVDEVNTGYTGVYHNFTISFTIPGSDDGTLQWTSGPTPDPSFLGTTFPGTYIVSPTQTTTYTLTATANNCTTIATATVTVLPPVIANAGPDQGNCNNGNFILSGNTPSSGTGTWSVVSGTATISDNSSPTSGVTGVPPGTSATLRWSITSPPCEPVYDFVLLSNSAPPVTTGINFCQGGAAGQLAYNLCTTGPVNIGPNLPFTGSTVTGTGTVGWVNAGNILSNNNSYSTVVLSNETSNYLQATNFIFAIPSSATINGIQVTIGRYQNTTGSGNDVRDAEVRLIKGGTRIVTNLAATGTEWPTSEGIATYGGPANLWGTTWTPADINAGNFGVALSVNSANPRTAYVDYIQITVTYTITGTPNWYTVSSGGSPVQAGSPFNPIGDAQVIASGAPYNNLTNTNTPGTYPFYLECSSYPGCRSTAINYIIDPVPTAFTVTGGGAYCSGGTGVNIGLSGSQTGVNYQLRIGAANTGAPVAGTGSPISFGLQTAAGTYTVVATSTSGSACQNNMNGSVVVSINPLAAQPGAFTASTATVCQGQNNVAYTVPNDPTVTYTWTYSGTGATITGPANSVLVSYSSTATSGTLSVTAANGCGSGPARTLAITVNLQPAIPGTISGSAAVCQSQTGVVYSVPAIPNAVNYAWTLPAGGSITAGSGTNNITVSFSASAVSGSITVRGQNPTCGLGPVSAPFAVTVSSLPVQPGAFIASTTTVCQGQNGVIYTVPSDPTVTYNWSYSGTGATITGTTNSVTVSYSATATSGNLLVTATNGCGTGSPRTLAITVNPLPSQPGAFTASIALVCQGQDNVTYTVPNVPTVTYDWTYSGTGATITGTTNSVTISYSATATSGTLSVTAANSCGASIARTLAITVSPLPAQPGAFTASTVTVCQGQNNVTYTVPNDPTVTYTWSYSGTGVTITGTTNSVTISYSATGTSGTLSVTATNSCGTSIARTMAITVNPLPAQPGAFTASTATVCQGQNNVTYTVPNVPSVSYTWSYSGTGATITGTTNSVTISYLATATSGTLSVTATNSCGTSIARTIAITVSPLPAQPGAFTASTATVCQGQNNVAYTIPNDPSVTYTWSYSGTGATITGTTNSVTISYSATATSGTLSVTATNSCGTSIARTMAITVSPLPAQPGAFTASTATVCQGQNNVAYTIPNDPSVTYTWSYSGTGATITGTTNSVTISYLATATSGTLSVTATNSCGTSIARTLAITVSPLPAQPGAFTASTVTVCQGQNNVTYTVPNDPTVTYTWSYSGTGATITGTTNSVTISYSATATSGTLSVTATNSCGTSIARTMAITVNPLPAQPGAFTASTVTVCQGQNNVTYTVPNDPTVTYTWSYSGTGATITGTTNSVTISYSATATSGTLSVTATNSCGTSIARTLAITVNPLPLQPGAFTASTVTVCQGQNNVTYTVPNVPTFTYTWSYTGTGATITGTTNSVTISYSATATSGTLSVTATNSCGTSIARTLAITVNPLPVQPGAFTASTATVCQGQNNVTYTVPNVPSVTYTWSYSGTGATITGNTNSVTISYSATATSGTLSVTATNSCGTSIARTLAITVSPLPVQPGAFTASTATVCQGQNNVTYTVPNDPSVTYTWSYSGTGATITGNTNSITISYSATATSGSLSVTPTNSCGPGIARTLTITVNTLPAPPTISASGTLTFCTGGSVTLTSSAGSSYLWSTGATTPGINVTTSGNYTVQITNAGGCLSLPSNATTVTVNTIPATPTITAGGPLTFCAGGSVTLTASAGTTYLWSNGATTQSIIATTSGNYSVQIRNAAGCLSLPSATTSVSVNASPAAPTITAGGPTALCTGGSVTLTSSAGSSYLWSTGATTQSINVSVAGNYTVQVTNAAGCLSAPSSATVVTVSALPATPTISAGGPVTFCTGGSVTLTSSAGTTYLWSTGATTQSINVTTSGNYTVQVTNAAGCQSIPSNATIVTVSSLPAAPTITAGGPLSFCTGGSVTLTSSAGTSYLWSTGATTQSINVTASGSYTVRVTNASGCQSAASSPTSVTVNTLPAQPTITAGGPLTFCEGGSVTLTASAAAGYLWSNGATTQIINVTTSGSYTVQVTNAAGCQSTPSAASTVTVSTAPAVPSESTDCSLGAGNASVTVTSPTGAGLQYSLDGGAYQSGVTFTGVLNGSHTITVRNAAGCTTDGNSFSVSCGCVNGPALMLSSTSGNTCGTTPATISGNTFSNATLVTITENGAGSVSPASTGTSPFAFTYTPAAGDAGNTVTITLTTNNPSGAPCAAAVETYTLTVDALPSVPTISASGALVFCTGGSVTLTSSAGTGYLWSTGATTPSINVTTSGNYSVRVTNAAGCQSLSSAVTAVTVNPVPATPTISAGGPLNICAGGSVTLTSSAGSTYLWSTGATTQSINVTTAGSFTVRVTNASGCQSLPSGASVVTVNPVPATPTISAGGPLTFCAGGSLTLTSSAGSSWLWSNGATTQSINVTTAGNYTVRVTNAAGCQSAPSTATVVTVSAAPAAPLQTTDCSLGFGNATVTVTSPTGAGLEYSLNGGVYQSGVTFAGVVNGNYTVTVRNSSGCTTTGGIFSVSCGCVNGPALSLGSTSGSTCGINPVTISGNTFTNATSVTITENGAGTVIPLASATSPFAFTYTPAAGDAGNTVTITVTTDNPSGAPCTPAVATYTLTVNALPATPTITAGGPLAFCAGGSVTLTSSAGSSYLWSNGAITQSINVTNAGNYSVRVTNAAGCQSVSSNTTAVTVNTAPAAPVHTTDCSLGSGNASVTVTSPTGAGLEYRLDGGVFQSGVTFNTVANGNHTITVRNASGCTTTGSSFPVSCGCLNGPAITLSSTAGNTCGTTPVTISGNTFTNATSVTITENGAGTITPATSGTSPFSFTYTPAAADAGNAVTITVTTDNPSGAPCTPAVATYTLNVNALPAIPTISAGGPLTFCTGGSVTLTSSGGPVYLWSNGATTQSINVTTAGSYTVRVTNVAGCQSPLSATTSVTVGTVPATPAVNLTQPTCAVTTGTITVTSPTGAGITYSIDGSTYTNTTGIFTGVTPNTYTVTARNTAGCTSAGTPVTINTHPVTPVVTNQTSSILSGTMFSVTPAAVPAGTTYTWTAPVYTGSVAGGSAQAAAQANISGTLTGTGTATYTVTPASGICIGAPFTVTVTVTTGCSPVSIGTQPADNSMCATSGNTSFTVLPNGTAPFTYQWEYNNGGTWAAVANGTPTGAAYTNANTATLGVAGISIAGSYQYRVYVSNCGGVNNAVSNAATLTVNPLPTVANQITSVLSGDTFTVTPAGVPAGTTYIWTAPVYSGSVTGGSAQAVAQANISGTLTGAGTATYTVTPTSGTCAGTTFTVTVTVTSGCAPVSIGTQPADNSLCAASGNASFTVVTNGTAPFTYQWEYNNGGTWAAVANGTPAGAAYTNASTATLGVAGISIAGSYQYRAYVSNCGGVNNAVSNAATLTVNPLPTVANQITSVLSGDTFTVTPAGVPAGTTYTWTAPVYSGSVTGGSAQTAPQANISGTLTGAGTATYTVTPTSGTCAGTTFTVTVTVTSGCAPVSVGTQPADNSMCAASGYASFSVVTNGTAPFTYQWEYNNGGTWAAVVNGTPAGAAYTNATTATLGVTAITADGSYQYRVYITNCTGANTATSNAVTLTVNPVPVVANQTASILSGDTFTVTPADVPAGTTYTWTTPVYTGSVTGGSAQAASQANISGTLTGTGTATYTVRPSSGSCTGATFTVTVTVTVGCLPVVTGTEPVDLSICSTSGNASFNIVAAGTSPFNWQWEYNDGGTWTSVADGVPAGASYTNANGANLSVRGIPSAGNYQYRANINNCGGTNFITSRTVTLTVNPVPTAPAIGTITQPSCAQPTGSVVLDGLPATGTWTINPGAITNSGVSTTVSGLAPGTYNFTVANATTCISPASVTVTMSEPEIFDFSVATSVSTDGNYNIDCAGAESGYISVEALNATGAVDYMWSDGVTGNTRTNLAAGTYRVIMTDADNCQADSSITLTEPELIDVSYEITEPTCPQTPDGVIRLTVTGGVTGSDYTYLWSDNSTNKDLTEISAGTYQVMVTDANTCSVSESVDVVSEQVMCLVLNEIFSPNGDLINDLWNIGNTSLYPSMEITIYNRWGQSVWKSGKGYPVPWDGKSNGTDLPIDSYHYVIDLHNGTKPILGNVTIVR